VNERRSDAWIPSRHAPEISTTFVFMVPFPVAPRGGLRPWIGCGSPDAGRWLELGE
jgi:hypothetical protein